MLRDTQFPRNHLTPTKKLNSNSILCFKVPYIPYYPRVSAGPPLILSMEGLLRVAIQDSAGYGRSPSCKVCTIDSSLSPGEDTRTK